MKANKGGIIDERYAVLIMREVLVALSFLHRSNVIHRDLKGAYSRDSGISHSQASHSRERPSYCDWAHPSL